MHKPFVITKELDKSSPLLYTAMINNENITEFELQFWTPQTGVKAGISQEKQHYTIRLKTLPFQIQNSECLIIKSLNLPI